MKKDYSFDVFLSYNAKDKSRVRQLAGRLRSEGIRVWFDEWNIKPGDDIYLAIEHGLEDARSLVLCLSPAALESFWVGLERSTAIFRDPTNTERRFIPLLLADCRLPDTFKRYKYVDFRKEDDTSFYELLDACRQAKSPGSPEQSSNPSEKLFTKELSLLWLMSLKCLYTFGDGKHWKRTQFKKGIKLVAAAEKSRQLFIVSGDPSGNEILIYDYTSEKIVNSIPFPYTIATGSGTGHYFFGNKIIGSSPDGSVLAIVNNVNKNNVIICDIQDRSFKEMQLGYYPVCPRFNSTGERIFFACPDGGSNDGVSVLDVATMEESYYPIGGDYDPDVCLPVDDNKCFIGTFHSGGYFLNLESGNYKKKFNLSGGLKRDAMFSPDKKGIYLLCASVMSGSGIVSYLRMDDGKVFNINFEYKKPLSFTVDKSNTVFITFMEEDSIITVRNLNNNSPIISKL